MSARDWLEARLPGAPPHLLAEMVAALAPPEEATIPDQLASAALALYARVVREPGTRTAALPLLAADALLTHAFEAQAEIDPAGLEAFTERWGSGGPLGEILP